MEPPNSMVPKIAETTPRVVCRRGGGVYAQTHTRRLHKRASGHVAAGLALCWHGLAGDEYVGKREYTSRGAVRLSLFCSACSISIDVSCALKQGLRTRPLRGRGTKWENLPIGGYRSPSPSNGPTASNMLLVGSPNMSSDIHFDREHQLISYNNVDATGNSLFTVRGARRAVTSRINDFVIDVLHMGFGKGAYAEAIGPSWWTTAPLHRTSPRGTRTST